MCNQRDEEEVQINRPIMTIQTFTDPFKQVAFCAVTPHLLLHKRLFPQDTNRPATRDFKLKVFGNCTSVSNLFWSKRGNEGQ